MQVSLQKRQCSRQVGARSRHHDLCSQDFLLRSGFHESSQKTKIKESVACTRPFAVEGLGKPEPQDRPRVSPHTELLCWFSPQTHSICPDSPTGAWTLLATRYLFCVLPGQGEAVPLEQHLWLAGTCWIQDSSHSSHPSFRLQVRALRSRQSGAGADQGSTRLSY